MDHMSHGDEHTTTPHNMNNQDHAEHAHPDDPDLQADHSALLDLMDARAEGAGAGVSGVATLISSGDWSNPDNWSGGVLPSENNTIVIPKGLSVHVDQDPGVSLMSVIVYGGLSFQTDADIKFVVDEILTGDDSVLHIGTPDDPVSGTIDIVIRDDTASVTDHDRVEIDPTQLGKGIVTHGEVRIEGMTKDEHLKVSADPMKGDTSLTFDELPEGWQVGDKIVIAGTHIEGKFPPKHSLEKAYQYGDLAYGNLPDKIIEDFLRDDPDWDPAGFDFFDPSTHPDGPGDWRFEMEEFKTQDEIRIVTGVSENADGTFSVHFEEPLEFNHDAPKNVGAEAGRDPVDMFTSVANYSRNVSITSEVAHAEEHPGGDDFEDEIWVDDNAGFEGGEIHLRGHVMFMHNPDVEVRNVEFAGLGRTDKSIPLDSLDWEWTIEGGRPVFKDLYYTRWRFKMEKDEDGNFVARDPHEIENMPGRYGVHFHRTGTDTSEEPAILEGSSVWGSPGWGVVHHDSHLNIIDNAVFGIRGGGIVSETGNETGQWNGNIVIKTSGSSDNLFDSGGTPREHALDDTFHGGDAFGFESRLIQSEGNIAVSAQAFGYKFIGPNGNNGEAPSQAFLDAQGYDPFWGDSDMIMTKIPNRTFVDNEAFASNTSFGSTLHKDFPNTQAVTLIDGFNSWHSDEGVSLAYARGYLFKDNIYVGDLERPDANGYRDHNGEPIGQFGINPSTDTDLNRGFNNHFENLESDFTAPPADVWVNNTATNVVNPFVDETEQAEIDANGGTLLKPTSYSFGTIFADTIDDLPRDINHLKFIQDGKLDLSISARDSKVTIEGIVEDALLDGSYEGMFRSTYEDPIRAVITNSSQGTLYTVDASWSNLLTRDGYFTDDSGQKYLLIDLVISSKITGTVGVHKVAVDIADDFVMPPLAVHNGPLPLGITPQDRFSEMIIVDLREPGVTGNQLTETEMADALALMNPQPAEGAGEYAYEIADNYVEISFNHQFNKKGNDHRGEMSLMDTDNGNRTIDIGQNNAIDLYGDGMTTFRNEFGQKLDMGKTDNLFAFLMEHGGKGDLHLVAGGNPDDQFFTVLMMTPEPDFLRIQGSDIANDIAQFYADHPEYSEASYSFPDNFFPDQGHDHDGDDTPGHGDGGDMPTNTPPMAMETTLDLDEDDATVTLMPNVMDADGDDLSFILMGQPYYGTATIDPESGVVSYTPDADYAGPDEISYMVSDGHGGSDRGTISIYVNPINDAPIANDDAGFSALTGQTLVISIADLLNNDTDVDGDDLTLNSVTGATLDGDHIIVDTSVVGDGSFTYTLSDGETVSNEATVSFTIEDLPNNAPIANDDAGFQAEQGTELRIAISDLLANDSDADGDRLSLATVSGAVIDGDDLIVDTSTLGDNSFTYTLTDGEEISAPATVHYSISAPVDSGDEPEDPPSSDPVILWSENFNSLSNGAREDKGETSWSTETNSTMAVHGVKDGQYELSRTTNQANDNDSVTTWRSEVIDTSAVSNVALALSLSTSKGMESSGNWLDFIKIFVEVDGSRTELYSQNGGGSQQLSFSDLPEGDGLVIEIVAKTTYHEEIFKIDDIEVSATPIDENGDGGSDTPPVDEPPVDDAPIDPPVPDNEIPVAQDDTGFTAEQGDELVISFSDLLANDSDADGDALDVSSVTGAGVTLERAQQQIVIDTSVAREGSFTYTLTDGEDVSNAATVSYTVTQAPDDSDDVGGGGDTPPALSDAEIIALVNGALNDRFGIGDGTLNFVEFVSDGLVVDTGNGPLVLKGTVAQDAITHYDPETAGHGGVDTKGGRSGIAVLDTDDQGDWVWLGGGTDRIDLDASGETTLKNIVGQGLRHSGSKANFDDLLDVVLGDSDESDDDLRIVAGGQAGDDFVTLGIDNGRVESFVIMKGEKVADYLNDYYDSAAPVDPDPVDPDPVDPDPVDPDPEDPIDEQPTEPGAVELTKPITQVQFNNQAVLDGESRIGVTTVDIGPDGNLYSADVLGNIVQYIIDPATGLATSSSVIANLGGTTLGTKFDPDSTEDSMSIWVSYSQSDARYASKIARIDIDSSGTVTTQDVIVGLPKGGHAVNGMDFGPDGKLYIAAGGLSSLGELSPGAFNSPETLMSAAVLVADVKNNPAFDDLPVNVSTGGSTPYDPYAPEAPVQIYATGLRNIYDVEWTKNGAGDDILVAGDNGNSLNNAFTPDDPSTPENDSLKGVKPPEKFVVIEEGGFYGHPNPVRGEYILNGGNPTSGNDAWQISNYKVGTDPEPGFDPSAILDVNQYDADSPNGSDTYIDGTILQTTFSGGRKILFMTVDENGQPRYNGDMQQIGGGDLRWSAPLDIAVDESTGRIYVANFGKNQSNPSEGGLFLVTPEAGALSGGPASGDGSGDIPPIDDPADPIDPGQTIRIEAENMALSGEYRIENNNHASGNQVISLLRPGGPQINGASGTADARFSGTAGIYTLAIGFYDESDGTGTLSIKVADQEIAGLVLNDTSGSSGPNASSFKTAVFEDVALQPGLTITITGSRGGEEYVRVDYIELTPTELFEEPGGVETTSIPQDDPASEVSVVVNEEDGLITIEEVETPVVQVSGRNGEIDNFTVTEMGEILEITQFNAQEGDNLDLSALLTEFDVSTDNLSEFVEVTVEGEDIKIAVDQDGGGDNFNVVAILTDVTDLDDDVNKLVQDDIFLI